MKDSFQSESIFAENAVILGVVSTNFGGGLKFCTRMPAIVLAFLQPCAVPTYFSCFFY